MADFRRRKATTQELAQGQEEIRLADERFRKDAVEKGEKALEDGPEKGNVEEAEAMMSPPIEDRGIVTQRVPQPEVPTRVQLVSRCSRPLILHRNHLSWATVTPPMACATKR